MSQITIYDTSSIMGDVSELTTSDGNTVTPTVAGNINILGLNGISTFGNVANTVNIGFETFTAQTTDATPEFLFDTADLKKTLGVGESIVIWILFGAFKSDSTEFYGGRHQATAFRDAGGTLNIFGKMPSISRTGAVGVTSDWVNDGSDNLAFQITGNADTYNWSAIVQYNIF